MGGLDIQTGHNILGIVILIEEVLRLREVVFEVLLPILQAVTADHVAVVEMEELSHSSRDKAPGRVAVIGPKLALGRVQLAAALAALFLQEGVALLVGGGEAARTPVVVVLVGEEDEAVTCRALHGLIGVILDRLPAGGEGGRGGAGALLPAIRFLLLPLAMFGE